MTEQFLCTAPRSGICLRIPGVPVAQPRQRNSIMKIAGRLMAHNYTPARHPVNQWKAAVALAWQQRTTEPPLEGPVYLSVSFVMPRPGRLDAKRYSGRAMWHDKKPDCDNLVKSLKDALSGLAWKDDAQVCQLMCSKSYAASEEQPHCEIYVERIADAFYQ